MTAPARVGDCLSRQRDGKMMRSLDAELRVVIEEVLYVPSLPDSEYVRSTSS